MKTNQFTSRDLSFVRRSADDHPPCDRRAAVQELYERTIMGFEYVSISGGLLRDETRCRALPGLGLADINCFGVSTRRTARHVVNDDLNFTLTLSGRRTLRERGREGVSQAGEAMLSDGSEVSASVMEPSRLVVFRLPRKAIAGSVPHLDDKVARPIRRDCEALNLLAGYANVLQDEPTLAPPAANRLAVTHVYDLITLALGTTRDAAETADMRGMRAARQQAVIAEITANFSQPDFSAQHVAMKLGLSPRYVQELLQESGLSFTERVLELRLQKAHSALADPHHAGNVAEIALKSGFSDISYFNRCFRRRFGETPSGMRGGARRVH